MKDLNKTLDLLNYFHFMNRVPVRPLVKTHTLLLVVAIVAGVSGSVGPGRDPPGDHDVRRPSRGSDSPKMDPRKNPKNHFVANVKNMSKGREGTFYVSTQGPPVLGEGPISVLLVSH